MKIITILLLIITNNVLAKEDKDAAQSLSFEMCNEMATFQKKTISSAIRGDSIADYIKEVEPWQIEDTIYLFKITNEAIIEQGLAFDGLRIMQEIELGLIGCYEKVMENK